MVNLKYYTAYGLQIASELPLPELVASLGQSPNAHIRYGSVPLTLPNPCGYDQWFQAVPGTFLFSVPGVARYLVVNGQEVWIERELNRPDANVRIYLLGSVLGVLLHQRQILALHASSIQTAQGAVLFVGQSGNGKSTLLAALLRRGYAMLADDVTGITLNETEEPMANPAFPCFRLGGDAASKLQYNVEGLPRVEGLREKYVLTAPRFCPKPLPVHRIYELNVDRTQTIKVEPVEGLHRFELMTTHTYRATFLHGLGLSETHFRLVIPLIKTVNIRRITRPASPFLLDELVDRIEEDLIIGCSSPNMVGTA